MTVRISPYTGLCSGEFVPLVTALSFADPNDGWFAYSCANQPQSKLEHTLDGGKTWTTLPAAGVPAGGITSLSFLDAQNGYLVTQSGLLLRTKNGGNSFLPVDNLAEHTSSLRFITSEVGWEDRGGQLFATQDGGRTWQALPISLPVRYFSLLSPQQAWLVTGEVTADNGNPTRQVFTTADGGRTLVEHPFGDLPATLEPPYGDSIQFVDAYHGWLRAGAYWFATIDGGKDWTQIH